MKAPRRKIGEDKFKFVPFLVFFDAKIKSP